MRMLAGHDEKVVMMGARAYTKREMATRTRNR